MEPAVAEQLAATVRDEVSRVLRSDAFGHWRQAKALNEGDLVLIDNSALYRLGLSTKKSPQYLGIAVLSDGRLSSAPRVITAGIAIQSQFSHVVARAQESLSIRDLNDAVNDELHQLGVIVFALVGAIGADQDAAVEIKSVKGLKVLAYDPTADGLVEIVNDWIIVSNLDRPEEVWRAVHDAVSEGDFDPRLPEALANNFDAAFHALREQAVRPVLLTPTHRDANTPTILSQIVEQMERQTTEYSASLASFRSDDRDVSSYNNLLRISYNFAEGAGDLLALFVGICDLKPILYWLTVAHQLDVVDSIGRLPLGVTSKRKPSLKQYRDAISGARNHAFHDFFTFARPLNIDLAGVDIKGRHLRLFREYPRTKSGPPAFDYQDRELIELLQSFTRAPERPVTIEFWERNLAVMEAVRDLTARMTEVLLASAPILSSG